jgi:hypothetical protein
MIFNGFTELVSLGFRVATRRQLGGNSREFSSIPVTRRRHPDNEQKNRDAQFAPKNGQKPKPRQVHGQETWPFCGSRP